VLDKHNIKIVFDAITNVVNSIKIGRINKYVLENK